MMTSYSEEADDDDDDDEIAWRREEERTGRDGRRIAAEEVNFLLCVLLELLVDGCL